MGRIVVGVDGSDGADRALEWAVGEAELHDAEIELVLGFVMQVHRAAMTTSSRDIAEATMEAVIEHNAKALGRVAWTTAVVPLLGRPYADAVLEESDDADLVVVGSRGLGGFTELLLGSTSHRVAAHATCPVAVIRDAGGGADVASVVVGIDGSRAARRALRWALAEAALRGVGVTLVHGFALPDTALLSGVATREHIESARAEARTSADRVVESALAAVGVPDGVTVTPQIVPGTPSGAILAHATSADLTVLGTRGFGRVRRAVLGSTSHQVLHHAPGTVVVVP
ncbi:MAG TPA: universal stress protein [Euzebyales bacterium]